MGDVARAKREKRRQKRQVQRLKKAESKLDKARSKKTSALAQEKKDEMPKTQFATNDGKVVVHIHMPNSGAPASMSQQTVVAKPLTGDVKAAEKKVAKEQKKVEKAVKELSSATTDSEIKAAKEKLE